MGWTFYNSSGQQLRNTGTVLATQAEMEAGSGLTSCVTPGRTKYHPGVAKVWVRWEQSGTHSMGASYNMTSVTDGGAVGDTDHVFNVDFSSDTWVAAGIAEDTSVLMFNTSGMAAGTVTTVNRRTSSNTSYDAGTAQMVVFGDQ